MTSRRIRLATHDGVFHADDTLAFAMLHILHGDRAALRRTRDPASLGQADIVFDVGGEFDRTRGRFDHHQRGAPRREDGTPFSAAGLVWQEFGRAVTQAVLGTSASAALVAQVATAFDDEVVRRIDEADNGIAAPRDRIGLAHLVADHNPPWNAPGAGDPAAADAAFHAAAELAEGVLRRRLLALSAVEAAQGLVAAALFAAADPRILLLDRRLPWQEAARLAERQRNSEVLYAIYPTPDGTWLLECMPPEPGSFAQRLPLPADWAGLRDGALAAACGVPDAVFAHAARFIAGAASRSGALAMARRALELGP